MNNRPGIRTTEFWLILLSGFVMLLSGLTVTAGEVNWAFNDEFGRWWFGLVGLYAGARGLIKQKEVKL